MAFPKLTEASKSLFLEFAEDSPNWGGTPLLGEGSNVDCTKEARGNLTQLKRAGLVETFKDGGNTFLQFTEAGREYAASLGVRIPR